MSFLTESLKESIDGDFLITSDREFNKTEYDIHFLCGLNKLK